MSNTLSDKHWLPKQEGHNSSLSSWLWATSPHPAEKGNQSTTNLRTQTDMGDQHPKIDSKRKDFYVYLCRFQGYRIQANVKSLISIIFPAMQVPFRSKRPFLNTFAMAAMAAMADTPREWLQGCQRRIDEPWLMESVLPHITAFLFGGYSSGVDIISVMVYSPVYNHESLRAAQVIPGHHRLINGGLKLFLMTPKYAKIPLDMVVPQHFKAPCVGVLLGRFALVEFILQILRREWLNQPCALHKISS